MKLVIESDGTMKGTKLEFQMTADEIPRMIARSKSGRVRKLKREQPPKVAPVVSPHDCPVLIS